MHNIGHSSPLFALLLCQMPTHVMEHLQHYLLATSAKSTLIHLHWWSKNILKYVARIPDSKANAVNLYTVDFSTSHCTHEINWYMVSELWQYL